MHVDLGILGFAEGGHLLVKRALRSVAPGEAISVDRRSAGDLDVHLRAWCRAEGHRFDWHAVAGTARGQAVIRARRGRGRTMGRCATRAGQRRRATRTRRRTSAALAGDWPRAARTVEAGTPEFDFQLVDKVEVWSDDAARIYAQAVAAQWDPETAIPWNAPFELADEVEDAVVQVMTYLIENETAALIVPSRFIAQLHPHFREVMQVLAVQAADEARHIEVFTRRAHAQAQPARPLDGRRPGVAQDAGRRAGLRDRVVPAVGARRRARFSRCSGSSSGTRPIR